MVHFDFEKLKAYFDNDKVILSNFLTLLQKELPRSQNEIESCFQKQDLKGVKNAAHKLKGSSLSAGLENLTGIASKINKLEKLDANAAEEIGKLKTEIALILPLVAKAIGDIS